ncbi:MAG: hypothetical protein K5Q00_08240 [Gammaproteobacteria bacterium]|nr:hypothetical protein [Gammaproteobacteria bacterium]
MRKPISLFMCAILALSLAACATVSPIRSASQQPVPAGLSQAQVGKIISSSAQNLGWQVAMTKPGFVTATMAVVPGAATVSIPYSSSSYSILYNSSQNMQYDGTQIQNDYNQWVQNLNDKIQDNLTTAATAMRKSTTQ